MNVLFAPQFRGNPYQDRLAEALRSLCVLVEFANHDGQPFSLLRAAWKRRADVVHLHWLHPFVGRRSWLRSALAVTKFTFDLMAVRLFGFRIIWTVHNIHGHEARYPRCEALAAKIVTCLAHGVIVHCEAARALTRQALGLGERAARALVVVNHPSYVGVYACSDDPVRARSELGLEGGATVFLCFGMIRSYKGVERLVEVFSRTSGDSLVLLIAGQCSSPDLREALERAAEADPRIKLCIGVVPDDRVQTYMAAADWVVAPFTRVLTSGSALLAMSFGKPVIAPRLGCMEEIVGEEGGVLYDAGDASGLERAIAAAMRLDSGTIGSRNLVRATKWTWAAAANATQAVYGAALQGRGTAGKDA